MKKILVSTSSFAVESTAPLDILHEAGFEVILNPYGRKLTKAETVSLLSSCHGVVAGTEAYSQDVLDKLPNLKIISRCGAGLDGIDIQYLKTKGIGLCNTPEVHVTAVAELTFTGLLACLKKTVANHQTVSSGKWQKLMGANLTRKKIGLVGYGKVARAFHKMLAGFECEVIVYDPFLINYTGIEKVEQLNELASACDVISLHIPLAENTRNIISGSIFRLVKKNVVLLNTSRGGLIDELALADFLTTNKEASAYLDVFETEPYQGALLALPNLLTSPHIGTFTKETRVQMEYEASINLINFFKHG